MRSGRKSLPSNNPVVLARQALGLSRQDMAMQMGIGYSYLAGAELGHLRQVPPSWRDAFQALGFQFDEVSKAYDTWRTSKAVIGTAGARINAQSLVS